MNAVAKLQLLRPMHNTPWICVFHVSRCMCYLVSDLYSPSCVV